MAYAAWFVVLGALLIVMALSGTLVKRMPLNTSVLYLGVGLLLGSHGLGVLHLDPARHSLLLERLSEVAVLFSLFTAGLKMAAPLADNRWQLPLRLSLVSMVLAVGMTAAVGVWLLDLPLGVSVLLGAVLAPTDPVLASDVQVAQAGDRDRLRFALTGEAGLNDGTAFPFVMLGLGLMGLHSLGPFGVRWLAVDVLWASAAGLGLGATIGTGVGKLVVHLRIHHKEALGLDEFLTLGLIALSYGLAVLLHAYGFLAVFAAGLALRGVQRRHTAPTVAARSTSPTGDDTSPEQAPSAMTQAVLGFNEQLEHLGELTLVLLIAGTLTVAYLPVEALWFVPWMLFVVRPLSVFAGTLGARSTRTQRALMGWFGIRGIGSVYYVMFAVNHGLPPEYRHLVIGLTLTTVAASIIVHGISVTPLMNQYARVNQLVRRPARPR